MKNLIEEKIISNEWPKGFQIPTEKELAKRFDVSTITVKRAILDMVHEGLLYRQRGKGTFVTSKRETDLQSLVTLKHDAEDEVKHPHRMLGFERINANPLIGKKLDIDEKDEIFKISRVKLNGKKPVVIEHTYLPTELFSGLSEEMLQDELLYSVLQNNFGFELDQAKIYFSTLTANFEEAELLNVPEGEQLFVIERTTRTKDGTLVEYSKFIIRQEEYQFYIDVTI